MDDESWPKLDPATLRCFTPAIVLPTRLADLEFVRQLVRDGLTWFRAIALTLQDGQSPTSSECRRLRSMSAGPVSGGIAKCLPHLPHDERAKVAALLVRIAKLDTIRDTEVPQFIKDLGDGVLALHSLEYKIDRKIVAANNPDAAGESRRAIAVEAALADLRAYVEQLAVVFRSHDERLKALLAKTGQFDELEPAGECIQDAELSDLLAKAEKALDDADDVRAGELACFRRRDGIDFDRLRLWLEPWRDWKASESLPATENVAEATAATSQLTAAGDGPEPPNLFHWSGQTIELGKKPWLVLDHLWHSQNRKSEVDEVCFAAWSCDHFEKAAALKSAITRLNNSFLKKSVPFVISTKNGWVLLSQLDSKK